MAMGSRAGGSPNGTFAVSRYQYQHLPLDVLQRRWQAAERLGFDVLCNCDSVVEPDRSRHMTFDAPTTLTLMAAGTTSIRVGTLVSSLYFRHPVTFTKAATTVDHLSSWRVDSRSGVGDPSTVGQDLPDPLGRRENVDLGAQLLGHRVISD
jgi:alkanesulfonate monooxygenase SsuD/methylene tetrahydromethanopterin reductase-like flavin-dependent oxidoreductase (luciferase family)